jgi:hypothetical protein
VKAEFSTEEEDSSAIVFEETYEWLDRVEAALGIKIHRK